MDILSTLRTLGALGLVLGMLWGALWMVRRYDLNLPGRVAMPGRRRVEMVERLPVDGRRSVALIRRDGVEHLILIGPEGAAVIETGITAPPRAEPDAPAAPAKLAHDLSALRTGFAALVERCQRVREKPAPEKPALRKRKRPAIRRTAGRKSAAAPTPAIAETSNG